MLRSTISSTITIAALSIAAFGLLGQATAAPSNELLGEIQLKPVSKIEKNAGIWVDGQYMGYLKELKHSKKILLMPGEHEITASLAGHLDFKTKVEVQAGEKKVVRVAMVENPDAEYPNPKEMARVKIMVEPARAAVFVNDRYVGHAEQFRGFRKFLGLAPGTYRIRITLPGYQPFDSELTLLAAQRYELKTELQKGPSPEPVADSRM